MQVMWRSRWSKNGPIVSLSLSLSLESSSKCLDGWKRRNINHSLVISLAYPDSRYLERGKTSQSRFPNTSRLRNRFLAIHAQLRDCRSDSQLLVSRRKFSVRKKNRAPLSLSLSPLPSFVSRSWRSLIITRQFHEEKRKGRKERANIYIYGFLHGEKFCRLVTFDCSESSFVSSHERR